MKKRFLVLVIILAMFFSACASMVNLHLVYPAPISADDSAVFKGSGLNYAEARTSAIENAKAGGYNRIAAEVFETNTMTGKLEVTLVMLK